MIFRVTQPIVHLVIYSEQYILMMNSHVESIKAYTHPNQQEIQQQSEDQTKKFEKGYKVFQLSSQVNEANLRIQKLCIKMEKDKRQNRKMIQSLTHEKRDLERKYDLAKNELDKINTMLESQRQARKIGNSINKKKKEELDIISKKLGAKSNTIESVLEAIEEIKFSQGKNSKNIQTLNLQIERIERQKNEQIRSIKQQKEEETKQLKQQLNEKIDHLSNKLNHQKVLMKNLQDNTRKLNQAHLSIQQLSQKLKDLEVQLIQQSKVASFLRCQNEFKQEELKKLRLKHELSVITKEKSRDEKIKWQQRTEEIRYQLCLSQKKIEFFKQRYEQEKQKTAHLQLLLQQKRLELKEREQKHIQLQQECQQLKKKIHICQIYKEKYTKSQAKIVQIEERACNFANIADQYAEQIQNLQQLLSDSEVNLQSIRSEIQQLKCDISEKQNKLNSLNIKISHQSQTIVQKETEIRKLSSQCHDLHKKVAVLEAEKEAKRKEEPKFIDNEVFANQIKDQVYAHFNQLLQEQSKTRKTLQEQNYQLRIKIVQLKNELSLKEKQLAQQKQENQLIYFENQRLCQNQSENQKHQERRIVQIRDKYKQIQRVKSQSQLKIAKKMKIECCFTYLLHNQFKRSSRRFEPQQDKRKEHKIQIPTSQQNFLHVFSNTPDNGNPHSTSKNGETALENRIIQVRQANSLIRRELKI